MDFLQVIKPVMKSLLFSNQPLPSIVDRLSDTTIGLKPFDLNGNLIPLIASAIDDEDKVDALRALLVEYKPHYICVAGKKEDDMWMSGVSIKQKDGQPVITFGNDVFPYTYKNLSKSQYKDRNGQAYLKFSDIREGGFTVSVFTQKDIGLVSLADIKKDPAKYLMPVGDFSSAKSYHALLEKGVVYAGEVVFPAGKEPFVKVTSANGEEVHMLMKLPKKNISSGSVSKLVSSITFQVNPDDKKEPITVDGKSYMCWGKPLDILSAELVDITGIYSL